MRALLILPLLFFFLDVFGQASSLGFKAGGNLSWLGSELDPALEMGIGFHGGVYFPVLLRPQLELQPEVLLARQGGGLGLSQNSTNYKLDYLSLPVQAKWFFTNEWNAGVGIQASFLLNGQRQFNDEEFQDVLDELKRHDFSLLFSAAFDSRQGLDAGLRFALGMTSLFRDDRTVFPKNRLVQVYLGYRLRQMRGRRR